MLYIHCRYTVYSLSAPYVDHNIHFSVFMAHGLREWREVGGRAEVTVGAHLPPILTNDTKVIRSFKLACLFNYKNLVNIFSDIFNFKKVFTQTSNIGSPGTESFNRVTSGQVWGHTPEQCDGTPSAFVWPSPRQTPGPPCPHLSDGLYLM